MINFKQMKKQNSRPNILVVNDDGITAPGIKNLIDVMTELGNVVVVAPDGPQSGMTNQEAYIVIDIGTGNVRVAVATTSGEILGIERENLQNHKDEYYPEALYFDPNALWEQILRLAGKALVFCKFREFNG